MRPEDIRRVLIALEGCAHSLNRDQVKQLYQILIACGQYPVCPVCNQPITSIEDFTWDHIVPESRGGSDDISNIILVVRLFVVSLTEPPAKSARICRAVKSALRALNTASVAITSLSQYSATLGHISSGTG